MRRLKLLSLAAASMLAIAASTGVAPVASPAVAQVLEAAVDASPAGLDPHIITAFSSFQMVNGTIYEGLTIIDKDLGIGPSLAESWTVSPDGKTYRFKLRTNVTFHDGGKMDAEDAAASLNRVMAKEIASPLASRLAAVDKITAVDAATVEVALKEPSAPLLTSLATIAIVPKRFATDKDGLQRQPMGTGPFKMTEWQPNSFVTLTKHDGYWQAGKPKLAGVKFNIVPESSTRQVGVSSGQYAILPNIDAATALQLKGKPNVKLVETLELAYTLVGFNTSKAPFDNPKVREAVNYALNRKEIIDAAFFGLGVPGGPLSPALKSWATDVKEFPCYAHDPAKAQAMLKAAGFDKPIELTMLVLPRQDIKDMAQVVQQQLNKAGFKIELKTPELGQFVQDWRNSAFDLFASTNAGSADPDDYFYRAFRTGGSTNVFKYSNADVDALLDKARATVDQPARRAAYKEVQAKIACDGPVAHIGYSQLFTALRGTVNGFDIIANRSLSSLADVTLPR
jgi:peptide/nickel transport system substrate-binding protein